MLANLAGKAAAALPGVIGSIVYWLLSATGKVVGKAAAALPGIIGSIVYWLLSATGKVVNWFGNNLWAFVVLG